MTQEWHATSIHTRSGMIHAYFFLFQNSYTYTWLICTLDHIESQQCIWTECTYFVGHSKPLLGYWHNFWEQAIYFVEKNERGKWHQKWRAGDWVWISFHKKIHSGPGVTSLSERDKANSISLIYELWIYEPCAHICFLADDRETLQYFKSRFLALCILKTEDRGIFNTVER